MTHAQSQRGLQGLRFESDEARNIVIFRALRLGDMLCMVPALRSLRKAYPHSRITLIGLPWAKAFVQRFSCYLDDYLEFPGYPGLAEIQPGIKAIPKFLKEAQSRDFDLAIQLHGNGSIANPLLQCFNAKNSAGYYQPGRYCPDEKSFMPYPESEQEILRHLRLLGFLGIPTDGADLEFPLCPEDEVELESVLNDHKSIKTPFVCLHPGASDPLRRWPAKSFSAVGDALSAMGYGVACSGSSEEAHLTQDVTGRMSGFCLDLGGKLSLGALAALLRRSRLVICNDTGISHLAVALRKPSLVLYLKPDQNRFAPLDQARHRVLYDISGITVRKVVERASRILGRRSRAEEPLCVA